MPYQWPYGYTSSVIDGLSQSRLIKAHKLKPLFGVFLCLSTGQTRSIPNAFLLYSYSFLSSYPGSAAICNTDGKENTEELGELGEEEVKATYIWLSCTLAVVTSAVKGTVRWPVVDVMQFVSKDPSFGMAIAPPCICVNTRAWHYSFLHRWCMPYVTLCFY